MKTVVNPPSVHGPVGAYSHGIGTPAGARWLHVSGQLGTAPDGSLPPGIVEQAENAWRNVAEVLTAGGMGIEDLVKVTVFVTDARFIPGSREGRGRVLGDAKPASTLLVVQGLAAPEYLIEVEAVAAKA